MEEYTFRNWGCFLFKCDLAALSQLIFGVKSCGQKQNAELLLNQVDLIFTVSHSVCYLSSHGLNAGNWQVSNIDGQMLVNSETWNLPKIPKSHKSVKSARQTGCLVKCPQPHIFTCDKKYIPQEKTPLLIYYPMNFWNFITWISNLVLNRQCTSLRETGYISSNVCSTLKCAWECFYSFCFL